MKKILLVLLLFSSTYGISQDNKVVNDPNAELRNIKGFEGVEVSGAIDLYFTQADEEKVVISAKDSEDIKLIETVVEDGILHIRYKKNKSLWSNQWNTLGHKFRAYVSCPRVKLIRSSGSGNIYIDGKIKSDDLEISLSGSGNVEGELIVHNLEVTQSGSSNINLKGSADKASFSTSGSGNVYAIDLVTQTCDISISGSGNLEITSNKELSGEISGSGNIRYKGDAVLRSLSTSGSGKFRKVG